MKIRDALADRSFLMSTGVGFVMLVAGLESVFYSTNYANRSASNSVTDIILSNIPVYDVEFLFVYGAMAAVVFSAVVLLTYKLHYLPFALKAISLLLTIRSVFVSLTHISPYPSHIVISSAYFSSYRFFESIFSGDDLFFSGHVGLTFLMSLIFWRNPFLRYTFLATSIVFAVVVLMGHLHYSIDVFAAFFITYTIYVMACNLFQSDYRRITTVEHA